MVLTELMKRQLAQGCKAFALGLTQTAPMTAIVVWLLSETVGWGFGDFLSAVCQPIRPLLELIAGA